MSMFDPIGRNSRNSSVEHISFHRIGSIDIEIYPTKERAAAMAAYAVAEQLIVNPYSVLGLATGNTMKPVYQRLIQLSERARLDWSKCHTINLDEYLGLAPTHPASYRAEMNADLFGPLKMKLTPVVGTDWGNTTVLSCPHESDCDRICFVTEGEIGRLGGIDLQLLGIGRNGHIGFNEPGSPFDSRIRKVELSQSTRDAYRISFGSDEYMPPHAITLGIGNILEARSIMLLAFGGAKADAVAKAILEQPTESCPASALQNHKQVRFLLDREAARGLGL